MKENCIFVNEDYIIVKENCIDLTSGSESTVLSTPSVAPSISNNVQSTSKSNLRK